MRSSHTLNPLYKNKIDYHILNLRENIEFVYGGQTETEIERRLRQHQRDDVRFLNMKIKKFFVVQKKVKLIK